MSRGIGDVRRVLGDPPTWQQVEFHRQLPELPRRHPDPLVHFVVSQILQLEEQARTEATEYRNRDSGPVVVRYAHYVLDLTAGYRRVVVNYTDALDAGTPTAEARQLRAAVAAVAAVWRKAREWRSEWSDEPEVPAPPRV
jgi:hypothetical protein